MRNTWTRTRTKHNFHYSTEHYFWLLLTTFDRFKFFKSMQQSHESLETFYNRLREAGQHCKFEKLEEDLVKILFMSNMNNNSVQMDYRIWKFRLEVLPYSQFHNCSLNLSLEKTTALDSNFTNLLLLTRLKGYTRPSVQFLNEVFSGAREL